MHGTGIEIIIDVQQTKIYNSYKNTKLKLLKTNAVIWFNKICKTNIACVKHLNCKLHYHANLNCKMHYHVNLNCKLHYHVNLNCKLYYQPLHLQYLCNLARY